MFAFQNELFMFEKEIKAYEEVLKAYRQKVTDRMALADLREYNEILFSAHSCAIEGNSFSVNDTRELKEKGLNVIPQGKTLFEAFEMLDHFRAYEYLLNQPEAPLSEELLKETPGVDSIVSTSKGRGKVVECSPLKGQLKVKLDGEQNGELLLCQVSEVKIIKNTYRPANNHTVAEPEETLAEKA